MTKREFNPYEQGYRERLAQRDAARTSTVSKIVGLKKYKLVSPNLARKIENNSSWGQYIGRGVRKGALKPIVIFDFEAGYQVISVSTKFLKPKEATLYRLKGYVVEEVE